MISQDIPQQIRLFFMAGATGIDILFFYDQLRIFRRVVKHNTFWIALEDMLFWIGAAFWVFRLIYRYNDGNIRGFVILGVCMGMLLYHMSLSRGVVCIGTFILRFLVNIGANVFHICSAPFCFLGRCFGKAAGDCGNFLKKNSHSDKKRLKNLWRAVKIVICKL